MIVWSVLFPLIAFGVSGVGLVICDVLMVGYWRHGDYGQAIYQGVAAGTNCVAIGFNIRILMDRWQRRRERRAREAVLRLLRQRLASRAEYDDQDGSGPARRG